MIWFKIVRKLLVQLAFGLNAVDLCWPAFLAACDLHSDPCTNTLTSMNSRGILLQVDQVATPVGTGRKTFV